MANLYTFGCSWANGTELPKEIEKTHRFSKLLANKLSMNEINISETGGSNIRNINLLLQMIINDSIKNNDIVLFQITALERHQIPLNTHIVQYPFIESGVSMWEEMDLKTQNFLKEYVSRIDDKYFEKTSKLYLYSLCNTLLTKKFKSIVIPAFIDLKLPFSNFYSKTMLEMVLDKTDNGFYENSHPTELGHKIISDYIYDNYL
jgi:hypothetical protein